MQYNWKFFACLFFVLVAGIVAANLIHDQIQGERLAKLIEGIGPEAIPAEQKMSY